MIGQYPSHSRNSEWIWWQGMIQWRVILPCRITCKHGTMAYLYNNEVRLVVSFHTFSTAYSSPMNFYCTWNVANCCLLKLNWVTSCKYKPGFILATCYLVQNDARVHGPWTRASFWTPVFRGRGYGPWPLSTGSVYQALQTQTAIVIFMTLKVDPEAVAQSVDGWLKGF